jgi:hypothetical protein
MEAHELESRARACLEFFAKSQHVDVLSDFNIQDIKQATGYYFADSMGTRIEVFVEVKTGRFLAAVLKPSVSEKHFNDRV